VCRDTLHEILVFSESNGRDVRDGDATSFGEALGDDRFARARAAKNQCLHGAHD
jgi:hypothetical protein